MNMPNTGNGYKENPLALLKGNRPPEDPKTIDDHVTWIVVRSTGIAHWAKANNGRNVDNNRVALELIARMEGTLQSLRTLIKSGPDKSKEFEEFLKHSGN